MNRYDHETSPIPSSLMDDDEFNDDEHDEIQSNEYIKDDSSSPSSSSVLDDLDVQGISLLSEIFPDASREELEELHYQRVESVSKLNNSISVVEDEQDEYKNNNEFENVNDQDECSNDIIINDNNGGKNNNEQCQSQPMDKEHNHNRNLIDLEDDTHLLQQSSIQKMSGPSKLPILFSETSSSTSTLTKRILQNSPNLAHERYNQMLHSLTEDFLRIPNQSYPLQQQHDEKLKGEYNNQSMKYNSSKSSHTKNHFEWEAIAQLEKSVIISTFGEEFIHDIIQNYLIKSFVIPRDMYVGLGLQLKEWDGNIYVNALMCHDGNIISSMEMYLDIMSKAIDNKVKLNQYGPAFSAGVQPGDRILGVSGKSFCDQASTKNNNLFCTLAEAVKMIADTHDPIILHIMRPLDSNVSHKEQGNDGYQTAQERLSLSSKRAVYPKLVHPLAICLARSGIIKFEDEIKTSQKLAVYTWRSLHWNKNSYLRDLFVDEGTANQNDKHSAHPAFQVNQSLMHELEHFSVNMSLVRQALCVRIVNAFVHGDRLAFTIWVYDVESSKDWYAPVRYFQDFKDLRAAIATLHKNVENFSFPTFRWYHESEASLSQSFKESRCHELETFLNQLCTMFYREPMEQSNLMETALYIQTFLGCDDLLNNKYDDYNVDCEQENGEIQNLECSLHSAIQLYTFRIFLLPSIDTLISNFIEGVKKRISSFDKGKVVTRDSDLIEKENILLELSSIRRFYSSITRLINDGCTKDFDLIAEKTTNSLFTLDTKTIFIDSVREQVEVHAFVPLRSILSKLLVYRWRYEDKEYNYKRQALQTRNQTFFKIKKQHQSPSNWQSVVEILDQGVDQSTLPCVKLRSIVNAGKEVVRLNKTESSGSDPLGADEFLPIFIFCVVRSSIERPNALSILLRNLCDESQLLSEIGYYLSSFKAAITFIQNLDLSSSMIGK